MKTTIAQQLKIKDFPFIINDKDGNRIYYENSTGIWYKREYDANGNEIYYEDSTGYWFNSEYDEHGNEIYYEDSDGKIIDNRPKQVELTLQQIADIKIRMAKKSIGKTPLDFGSKMNMMPMAMKSIWKTPLVIGGDGNMMLKAMKSIWKTPMVIGGKENTMPMAMKSVTKTPMEKSLIIAQNRWK